MVLLVWMSFLKVLRSKDCHRERMLNMFSSTSTDAQLTIDSQDTHTGAHVHTCLYAVKHRHKHTAHMSVFVHWPQGTRYSAHVSTTLAHTGACVQLILFTGPLFTHELSIYSCVQCLGPCHTLSPWAEVHWTAMHQSSRCVYVCAGSLPKNTQWQNSWHRVSILWILVINGISYLWFSQRQKIY